MSEGVVAIVLAVALHWRWLSAGAGMAPDERMGFEEWQQKGCPERMQVAKEQHG